MDITMHNVGFMESISNAGQDAKFNFREDDIFLQINIETESNHNACVTLNKEQVRAMSKILEAYIPLINEVKE